MKRPISDRSRVRAATLAIASAAEDELLPRDLRTLAFVKALAAHIAGEYPGDAPDRAESAIKALREAVASYGYALHHGGHGPFPAGRA